MAILAVEIGHNGVTSYYGDVSGRQYKTDVRFSDFTNAPAWSFQTDNPPVSVRTAAQLAAKSLTETLGSLKDWKLREVNLMEWSEGNWIYRISFEGPVYDLKAQPNLPAMKSQSGLTVFVLMNGKVFGPKPIQK